MKFMGIEMGKSKIQMFLQGQIAENKPILAGQDRFIS